MQKSNLFSNKYLCIVGRLWFKNSNMTNVNPSITFINDGPLTWMVNLLNFGPLTWRENFLNCWAVDAYRFCPYFVFFTGR